MTPNNWYETLEVPKQQDETLNDEATNSALFKLAVIVAAAILLYASAELAYERVLAVFHSIFGG